MTETTAPEWITDDPEGDDPVPTHLLAVEPVTVTAEPAGLAHPAIPGINLSDYSLNAQQKGWGAPCAGPFSRVALPSGAAVTVDSRIAELVGLIMRANEVQGYSYRPADTGAYNCRKIGTSGQWSNHAWGLAVDSNWQTNPFTRPLRTDRPRWELDRWNRYGFAWGGDYLPPTPCDAMHTEAMGTPAQMAQALVLARAELGPIINGRPVNPTPWLGLPNLVYGQASRAALDFQRWYNAFPFVPALLPIISPVSTNFGPQTLAAVKKVQARYGLAADGIVGPATKHLLWTLGWRG